MSKELGYTYLDDGSRDWGKGVIGPSLADELRVNYFLDSNHPSNSNLNLLLPLAGLALVGCGTTPSSPDQPLDSSPIVSQPDQGAQNLGWQFPFWGRGYFTGGGGGAHSGHLDFSVAAGLCEPEKTLIIRTIPIRPMAPGVVAWVGKENNPNDPRHSMVRIDHPNGYSSEYEHLGEIKVQPGDKVAYTSELGFTSCEHSPDHFNSGPHVDVALYKGDQPVPFDESQPIAGWAHKSLPGDRNGILAKSGEEPRVANTSWCREESRNSKDCEGTINYIDFNPVYLTKNPPPDISPLVVPTVIPTPTEIPQPTPTPAFTLKDQAVISGTGSCLNIREQPSTNSRVQRCEKEGSSVFVTGGPVYTDGYLWWQLSDGNWAVQDYLRQRPLNQIYSPTYTPITPTLEKPTGVITSTKVVFKDVQIFEGPSWDCINNPTERNCRENRIHAVWELTMPNFWRQYLSFTPQFLTRNNSPVAKTTEISFYCMNPNKDYVGATFDAGPHNIMTASLAAGNIDRASVELSEQPTNPVSTYPRDYGMVEFESSSLNLAPDQRFMVGSGVVINKGDLTLDTFYRGAVIIQVGYDNRGKVVGYAIGRYGELKNPYDNLLVNRKMPPGSKYTFSTRGPARVGGGNIASLKSSVYNGTCKF
ncbi:MAG: M23 family metallopeptidase [Candidatus Daviesbacteria bacterium]|nr:MAG: M23 family metallopeptidase [Candidatus Daviesbacteria bacterium]